MLSLSLLYLMINVLLIIAIAFSNTFSARKKTTALIPPVLLLWIIILFDAYINGGRLQSWLIKQVEVLTLFNQNPTDGTSVNIATFIVGMFIIIELFAFYLMLYALYANVFSYSPPILRSEKEKQTAFWNAVLWKSLLYIACNLALVFVLQILNSIVDLPFGFLEPIFKLGVRL